MMRVIKLIFLIILFFIALISVFLFLVKISAYKNATSRNKYWNESISCYFIAYTPNYKYYGGVGRVLKLFSNQYFLLSIMKEKLRSSAWHFWEYQFSDHVAPEWSGDDVLYPSDHDWSGWTLHECKGPS